MGKSPMGSLIFVEEKIKRNIQTIIPTRVAFCGLILFKKGMFTLLLSINFLDKPHQLQFRYLTFLVFSLLPQHHDLTFSSIG